MLKNTFIALRGTVIAQGIGFLLMPFLTRLYAPSEFGSFQRYISILTLVTIVASLRYEWAILTANRNGEDRALFSLCLILNLLVSLLLSGVLLLAAVLKPERALLFDPSFWLLAFGVLFGGLLQTLGSILLRENELSINALSKILQVSVFCVSGVAAAGLGYVSAGLIGADVAGRMAAVAAVGYWLIHRGSSIFSLAPAREIVDVARKFSNYPLLTVPGALLSQGISSAVPLFMIGAFGEATTGQYALVERVVLIPAGLIGQSVALAFTAKLSESLRTGAAVTTDFRKVVVAMAALGLVPTGILMVFGPALFELLFGNNWSTAGHFAQFVSIAFLSSLIMAPVNMTLVVIGRQRDQFRWEIARLILLASVWIAVLRFKASPEFAVGLHSLALFAINMTFVWIADRRLREMPVASSGHQG